MLKKFALSVFCVLLAVFAACQSNSDTSNVKKPENSNAPALRKATPDGKTTPGIPSPDEAKKTPDPQSTPTPGIPKKEDIVIKPDGKKTPGIPSKEELEAQKKKKLDINDVNNPPERKTKPVVKNKNGEPLSPIDRKRRVDEPKPPKN